MPSKRLIATLVLYQGQVVQSIGFNRYLPVGKPEIAARFLSEWGADEIVLLDIEASKEGRTISPDIVERTASRCFVPLSVGGGLRSLEQMQMMLSYGADKIVVNSALLTEREKLREAIFALGTQCLVASIDVKKEKQQWVAYTESGSRRVELSLMSLVCQVIEDGFGEIMLNSIDRDGMKSGYDLDVAKLVGQNMSVPLILVGGAGHPDHIIHALRKPYVSAVGAGNFLHYEEHSIAVIKSKLMEQGIDVRLGSQANYEKRQLDVDGRLIKIEDGLLDNGAFEYLPDERYDLL